jgi:hypothetical protein
MREAKPITGSVRIGPEINHRFYGHSQHRPGEAIYQACDGGLHIKGHSSFEGCAFEDQIGLQQLINSGESLVSALEKAGIAKERATATVDKIGFPDLSAQVPFEGGSPIACFLVNGRLHTVMEARQRSAPLNECIFNMLLVKPEDLAGNKIDAAARQAAQTIRTKIGMSKLWDEDELVLYWR